MKRKARKNRYILYKGDVVIGEAPSLDGVAKLIGITRTHIHNQITETNLQFKFRKDVYTIVDKLS